jgi:N-acetylneuraminate synthase/N,N'-diacetyllegionaminate synthase
MGTLGEVESALGVIRQVGGEQIPVVVLHCTSEYPARPEDMNLRAMTTMAQAFHVPVGLSDHSQGIEAAIAAIALGGCVIEKHFTLDRKMDGPDHEASLEPEALAALVQAMRRTAIMLGDGIKQPVAIEQSNMVSIRRSVVASRDLPPNTVLQLSDLICKRPGHGIAPANLNNLVGMRINRAIEMDEPILWNDLISG